MIIVHVRQAFKDTSGSKSGRVLNVTRLYVQELRRVPDMFEYGFIGLKIAPEYALIS